MPDCLFWVFTHDIGKFAPSIVQTGNLENINKSEGFIIGKIYQTTKDVVAQHSSDSLRSPRGFFIMGCCIRRTISTLKSAFITYCFVRISSRWCEGSLKKRAQELSAYAIYRYPLRPPVNISDSPTLNWTYNKVIYTMLRETCHSLPFTGKKLADFHI